jgi:hypothetical protein
MWAEVDKDELMKEQWVPVEPCTQQEVEQIVVLVRLELHNASVRCGPKAIRERMESFYHVVPLPSTRTVARILARNGLTYGRTDWYEGDEPEWVPGSARRPRGRGQRNCFTNQ